MKINQIIKLREDHKDMETVAFGDMKHNDEADTEWEQAVFQALYDFVGDANPSNKVAADQILKDVHAIKSQYPADLLPEANTAYRGTQLPKERYASILASVDWAKVNSMGDYDAYKVSEFSYSPRSPIQSWTTNEEVAFHFAATGQAHTDDRWSTFFPFPAVLVVDVDHTFIMSTAITNHIASMNDIAPEWEIIRTSAQPIQCKLYVLAHWLTEAQARQ